MLSFQPVFSTFVNVTLLDTLFFKQKHTCFLTVTKCFSCLNLTRRVVQKTEPLQTLLRHNEMFDHIHGLAEMYIASMCLKIQFLKTMISDITN